MQVHKSSLQISGMERQIQFRIYTESVTKMWSLEGKQAKE